MTTIETVITVLPDGDIRVPHLNLAPGQYRAILVPQAPAGERERATEALRAAGLLTELSPEEKARAAQSTLTLDESRAILDRAGGPPLSDLILELRGSNCVDSSALAKRYLTETGSLWVAALLDPRSGNTLVIAEITRIEVAAALAARQRAATISLAERDALVNLLLRHCDTEYRIIALNSAIVSRAVALTQQYRLRGYDAVQLATALAVATVLPDLTLITADDDLLSAARAEGLAAENPNAHP